MDNSVYISLSRQVALFRDLEATANNLANSNTVGYNSEEMLHSPFVVNAGKGTKISFDNDISTYRVTEPGKLSTTGNPLDVAINGRGYFTVETPLGPRYTRAGNFQLDAEGNLTTASGYPVLDDSGQRIQFEPTDNDIVIGALGSIQVNGEERTNLGLVVFQNEQMMEQAGDTMYKSSVPPLPADESITVSQGVLETSNVEPVKQITHLVDLQRSLGSATKMIDTLFELQRRTGRTLTQQSGS